MDQRKSQDEEDFTFFRRIFNQSGFWSCIGYDGLSIAFDLPIDDFRSLPEARKRALMGLLGHLARVRDESLLNRIHALEGHTNAERLVGLLDLSEQL